MFGKFLAFTVGATALVTFLAWLFKSMSETPSEVDRFLGHEDMVVVTA